MLAGGLGTRLRQVVSDVPKPMAPVAGRPFLEYLLRYLRHHRIHTAVLSVGFKAEAIESRFGMRFGSLDLAYAKEAEPLGTGGGIRLALERCQTPQVAVINGDSFFDVDLAQLYRLHQDNRADATLALREVPDTSRYGTIELEGSRVNAFREKSAEHSGPGFINGGIYLLGRERYLSETPAVPFSIEQDFFAPNTRRLNFQGLVSTGYFIDIGVPEDYQRAQHEFADFPYR